MVKRRFWLDRLEKGWARRNLVWLRGVRRVGKTTLCRSLPGSEYFDCEIPRVRRMMEDPEFFLAKLKGKRVILDEVHRLADPSELLKIAADHFPDVQVVATGSSSLQASRKFRDTLTGRKVTVDLTPMNEADGRDFGAFDLARRLLRGGLPPFYLARERTGNDFQEWLDSFWAKDIQELYRLERRSSFQRFVELILARSGGIFEANAFAAPCEISRTTVANYLRALEDTRVAQVVRPFSGRRSVEIVAAPKVFGFDTGFVAYYREWDTLSPEARGSLWEHYVLNEWLSRDLDRPIHYWRDKQGHEVDFVIRQGARRVLAVECKWSWRGADLSGLRAFRRLHPEGPNWVLAPDVDRPIEHREGTLDVVFLNLSESTRRLTAARGSLNP